MKSKLQDRLEQLIDAPQTESSFAALLAIIKEAQEAGDREVQSNAGRLLESFTASGEIPLKKRLELMKNFLAGAD